MTRLNSSIRLILAVISLFAVTAAGSQCQLEVNRPSPLFVKQFGSHKFVFKSKENTVSLKSGESLTAQCSNKVKLSSRYSSPTFEKSVELFCNDNSIEYKASLHGQRHRLDGPNTIISCDDPTNFNLYESSQKLPNCHNFTTYGIGIKITNAEDIIVAGVCYDVATLSLKYASYVACKPSTVETTLVEEPTAIRSHTNKLKVDLTDQLDDLSRYFSFMSEETFNTMLDDKKWNEPLMLPFTFDYENLLQDSSLLGKLSGFSYIFNTMWWRHLRLGNWRFYLNALAQRAQDVTYIVYTGTHGRIFIPAMGSDCKRNMTLVVGDGDLRVHAPAYIWSYVKSLQSGVGEEFVVIAHNSPYEENPSSNVFCTDMCDEIEWLKNSDFGRMRRKTMLGYTFCCRPAEVAAVIGNFSAGRSKMLVPTTTTTTTTTPTLESNENSMDYD